MEPVKIKHDVVDAFVSPEGGGNPAGVVFCRETFYPDEEMLKKAEELGFSETVFMLRREEGWHFRYFTPVEEVPLCGHATVAAIHLLGERREIERGAALSIRTAAGFLAAEWSDGGIVWMDMAEPRLLRTFSPEERDALYRPFPGALRPGESIPEAEILSTGLADIILPVPSREVLNSLQSDPDAITQISRQYQVCGYHLFAPGEGAVTAFTRNFAPLLGIPEEAATGTASGALSYYLYRRGMIAGGEELCFLQGEAMGLPSCIYAKIEEEREAPKIRVGGRARIR